MSRGITETRSCPIGQSRADFEIQCQSVLDLALANSLSTLFKQVGAMQDLVEAIILDREA